MADGHDQIWLGKRAPTLEDVRRHRLKYWALGRSRAEKRAVAVTVDVALCCGTVALAYYLRLGDWTYPRGLQWLSYASALVIGVPLFIRFGLYRAIFRYVGWGALSAVVRACAIYGLLYAAIFSFLGVVTVPRTVGLIQPILLFLAVGSSRATARYWLGGGYLRMLKTGGHRRVLVYGAGSAGRQLAAALRSGRGMKVIAFVDDDPTLHGHDLDGKPIHPSTDLAGLIDSLEIDDVLLAIPSASRRRRNEILESLRGTPATIRTLPGVDDIASGRVTVNDLHELDIADLLARDAVPPNYLLLSRSIAGKRVMVTGAGGSIGSELSRQIAQLRPETLLLVDSSEFNLYSIHRQLEARTKAIEGFATSIVPLLGSVQDERRIDSIMEAWKPHTVYHAAAYKHVPLVEHNPAEGLRNNLFGTLVTARSAIRHGVADMVLISTDKAVRPTNVMGASKRLAEMVLQALAAQAATTRLTMVRFGNVLDSSGSVVPLFRAQIRTGGPVTITDPEMTRYFMTIPEAAQLVLQAGAMGESGSVYILDMGNPVRIFDLARRMIELSGLAVKDDLDPEGDIEIVTIGLRPGEKLYEELLIGDNPEPTSHPRIMKANERFIPWARLEPELDLLKQAMERRDLAGMRDQLTVILPEFRPDREVVDWVHQRRSGC